LRDISFITEHTVLLDDLENLSSKEQVALLTKIVKETYDFLSIRNIRRAGEGIYQSFKVFVENLSNHVLLAKICEKEKELLVSQILSIKVGAKVPIDTFVKESVLKEFILINGLAEIFFTTKLVILFHKRKGYFLPVELEEEKISWQSWMDLTWKETARGYGVFSDGKLLFKTGKSKKLTREYSTLWYGITQYDRRRASIFRPYKHTDPSYHGGGHLLQVVVTWEKAEKFSYLAKTHVSLEIKDDKGAVRSVGQDIYDHIRVIPKRGFFRAASRSSIIKTPDDASYYPRHFREIKTVSIPLTKKEHDQIVYLVESDKYNHKSAASLLKGNCVSYVRSILKRVLGYEVLADISAHELLLREFLPNKLEPFLHKAFEKVRALPFLLRRALYFAPPLYPILASIGLLSFISSYYGHNHHKEYHLYTYLFFPWRIRCDIPRLFYDVLVKYTDENGVIDRKKHPELFCFD
jgi:hypothetical protein